MDRNREIDRLVADKVMGSKYADHEYTHNGKREDREGISSYFCITCGNPAGYHSWPSYSTDIAAAWLVVEKMRRDGWRVTIRSLKFPARETELWEVWLHEDLKFAARGAARGQSVAEAICLAALKAVGVDVKEKADVE